MNMLEGKAGLVTGSGSGIGRATAQCMAGHGAEHVVVADIDFASAEETCRLIADAGGTATPVACDVAAEADVTAMVKETVRLCGRIDFAVNNAGYEGVLLPMSEYPIDTFDRVMEVNVKGMFLCMQEEIRQMQRQGFGAIACTASVCSFIAVPDFSAYNAAKHAVMGLVRSAAVELAPTGIRVNALAPGTIETPMTTERGLNATPGSEVYEKIAESLPNKRWGKPEEMAEVLAWLCSDAASMVNGHGLAADAGYIAA